MIKRFGQDLGIGRLMISIGEVVYELNCRLHIRELNLKLWPINYLHKNVK